MALRSAESELWDAVNQCVPNEQELRRFIECSREKESIFNLPGYFPDPQLEEQRSTPADTIIVIRNLGKRAHSGEPVAVFLLLMIALESTERLRSAARRWPPIVQEISRSSLRWPVIHSPFAVLRSTRKEVENLELGRLVRPPGGDTRARVSTAATYVAAAIITFMGLVRGGRRKPEDREWSGKVINLPPPSRRTIKKRWWPLAREAIHKGYPRGSDSLELMVFGPRDPHEARSRQDAFAKIREAFLGHAWKFFPQVETQGVPPS